MTAFEQHQTRALRASCAEAAEVVTGSNADTCRFCQIIADDDGSLSVWSNSYVAAFKDAYPSAPGHMLVVPTRHVQYARDLCREEWLALAEMVHDLLTDEGDATVGINDGPAAGQTVPHLHVHVIPRSAGDVADPRGGIRWVLPGTADYWTEREDSPQAVTYMEALLEGANPDEGFYE